MVDSGTELRRENVHYLVGPLEFIQKKTLYEFDKLSTQ